MQNEIIENINKNKDIILCVNTLKDGQRDDFTKLLKNSNINYELLIVDPIGDYELNAVNKDLFIKSIQHYTSNCKTVYVDISHLEDSSLEHYKFLVQELKKANLQVLIVMDNRTLNKSETDSKAYFFSSTNELLEKLENVVKEAGLSKTPLKPKVR
jgi:hypothetical protein